MQKSQGISRVQQLLAKGNLLKARKLALQLYKKHPQDEQILKACVLIFARMGDLKKAVFFADSLLKKDPGNFGYVTNLANWCLTLKKRGQAVNYYQNFVNQHPGNPAAYFQLGLLYKQELEYEPAVRMFERAIDSGFKPLEECYLNIALTHGEFRREPLAIHSLEKVIELNPRHLIASLDLATLYQAAGRIDEAESMYEQILARDPTFSEALIRLIYARKITRGNMQFVEKASGRARSSLTSAIEKEGLNYALGKANDDLRQYETAFGQYRIANELQAKRVGVYEPVKMERFVGQCIAKASSEWLDQSVDQSGYAPIFIVGHFRSGSTLVEQILSGHSAVSSLGEVDYFLRFFEEHSERFQSLYESEDAAALQELATGYKKLTSTMSEGQERVTDKRPENLLFMGLIKKIFPQARFIHTRRNLLDNGVSVYFQQLNDLSRFATSLESFADYDNQCQKLMSHWQSMFAESIYEINYEHMVREPEKYARELISFLQLDWEPGCLDFENRKNFVRTASVSQVREKIYTSSVGRGMNYYPFLTGSEKARYADHANTDETNSD